MKEKGGNTMAQQILPKREELNQLHQWHIEDIYQSDTFWEKDYAALQQSIPGLSRFVGTFQENANSLLSCLQECNILSQKLDGLYVYAFMRLHENSENPVYQELSERAESLLISYSTAISFLVPEILSLSKETMDAYEKEHPDAFALYHHFLENILRKAQHTLSPAEEVLLAKTSELGGSPQTIFAMLNDADLKFPKINNKDGEELELTKGRYTTFLESPDRLLRKSAFDTLYDTYTKQKNTLAAIYSSSVKADVFFAKTRNYPSSLAAALDDDRIPLSVYDNLIDTVHQHLPLLHRYVALRKKIMGLSDLHFYDLYTPLVQEAKVEITYEEAKKTVVEALSIMGAEYTKALKNGLESGWIDVYENQGKRSGAYSWGTYGIHPFVLLNHNNNINSMFTLAHEMGHALHSYFTWEKQSYLYGGHKIFVAEVASTCNEALLMSHLLETTTDKTTRAYLINYYLEQFRGTFFRQTMFAEFEKETHLMAEAGQPLTCENLCALYRRLNEQYFGKDIVIDDHIAMEWARIPHFYNAFYVYQYATGYSAAIALSKQIREEGDPAIKRYISFLEKGNSLYSIDLLKGAGVDMTTTKPLEEAMTVFEELLDELEHLL